MDNKALWTRVFTTDPRHVKPITGKDYGGNSPKPYWIVERLTDEFGPCGIGWGYSIDDERFERFSDTDVLHVARVTLWYMLGEQKGTVTQMGQTRAAYVTSKSVFKIDEDAPKKSVTDALVKCASYLGFAGDIFSGRWDDSKYIAEAALKWRAKDSIVIKPTDGAEKHVSPDRRVELDELAAYIVECHETGNDLEAIKQYAALADAGQSDETVYLWQQFGPYSKLRATIKANRTA